MFLTIVTLQLFVFLREITKSNLNFVDQVHRIYFPIRDTEGQKKDSPIKLTDESSLVAGTRPDSYRDERAFIN